MGCKNWVLSSQEQANNAIYKIYDQKKVLQKQASNKVKGAKEKLANVEINMQKLLDDYDNLGFDTKTIQDEVFGEMFVKYIKYQRGGKNQRAIISDMTDEFYEMSDFLDNVGGDRYDVLLDNMNKGKKIDAELLNKHLGKGWYERFMNLSKTYPSNNTPGFMNL